MEIPLAQMAQLLGGQVLGDPQKMISGAAPFDLAGPDDITVAGNARYVKRIAQSNAGAIIVAETGRRSESKSGGGGKPDGGICTGRAQILP